MAKPTQMTITVEVGGKRIDACTVLIWPMHDSVIQRGWPEMCDRLVELANMLRRAHAKGGGKINTRGGGDG